MIRNFIYVSPTKVDMLHAQIGSTLLSKLKVGFSIKAVFAEAKIETETREKDIYNKVEDVRNHILLREKVGTIEAPSHFLDDSAELRFAEVVEYASSIAFFGEVVGDKKFALIGSAESFVGAPKTAEANHAPFYYTMKFISQEIQRKNPQFENIPYVNSLEDAVDIALQATRLPPVRVSFTAITLHNSPGLLVATPIFVSYAD